MLGNSFDLPKDIQHIEKDRRQYFLAGANKFLIDEIEVFKVERR